MTKRALILGFVLATIAAGCGGGHVASSSSSSLPGLDAKKVAKIEALVKSNARADGDAQPSSAWVYASRRHEANIAAGAGSGVPGSQPVYLVVVQGRFVCSSCSGPPGHAPPRGSVMTFVLDRKTLSGLDFGIGGHVDTGALGPGLRLSLG